MRYLGIDYGLKFVGVAISDEEGTMAFPETVLPYGTSLAEQIQNICLQKKIGAIVIGESKDFQGEENSIMKHVHAFKAELEQVTGLEIILEPEFLTSHQAAKLQHEPGKKNEMIHASAAALILQSFLDRKQNKEENQNKNQNQEN
jgi:putative Holliday junction resolvase